VTGTWTTHGNIGLPGEHPLKKEERKGGEEKKGKKDLIKRFLSFKIQK